MTTTRTHFTFRVETWTPDGESIMEHVAGVRLALDEGCAVFRLQRSQFGPPRLELHQRRRRALRVGIISFSRVSDVQVDQVAGDPLIDPRGLLGEAQAKLP